MTKLNKSPERNSFQSAKYLERKAQEGKTPENDEDVAAMMDYFKSESERKKEQEQDPAWQQNNMEYDLRSTTWICDKVKASEVYAQNLYAAMCNQEFQKLEVWPVLKGDTWSCSWRYSGGIIADMREEGDYIDWYCSGIRDIGVYAPDDGKELTEEQKALMAIFDKFVGEGVVTDEVKEDLLRLGWCVVDND